MDTTRMFHQVLRGLVCVALLGASSCGDDGSGDGTEASSSGTETGSGSTTASETTAMTTASDESTSGATTGTESSGSSSGGADSSGSGSESTGTPVDCSVQADQKLCEMTEGCVWVGNVQNGECLTLDPAVCPELEMQACQQHPACDWNNQEGACTPA